MALTRDEILKTNDIQVNEIEVPEWGGSVFIKQLTRAQQDSYLKMQMGKTRMKQDTRAKNQEIIGAELYGHDAYLCSRGICDENGKAIFKDSDIQSLKKKNGAVIGRIAKEIIAFSDMAGDDIDKVDAELEYYREKHPESTEEFEEAYHSKLEQEVKN
jgi:hypothetical protein